MTLKKYIFIQLLIFSIFVTNQSRGETTITADGAAAGILSTDGVSEISTIVQDGSDTFGPAIANGFSLANIGGYPIGKAYLGGFPHFFLGVSATAGLTNMQYRENKDESDENKYPAGGINAAVYFGLGLGKGFDMMGKVLTFSDSFKSISFEKDYAKITKLNIMSTGGKLRYNLISEKTILPLLLSFGGLTVSLGFDYLYATVGLEGEYDYPLDSIEITTPVTQTVDIDFTPTYTLEETVNMISGNMQIIAYFDFFFIFDLYSGFGFPLVYGSFKQSITGSGTISTDNAIYTAANGGSEEIGSITLTSNNKYKPYFIMPVYIIGFDINLILIRLTVESMVNLRNGSDVNIQIGTRIQI